MNSAPLPQPVKIIRDLETLKVLTDPLRMRILALLRERPRPVKEVAQALEIPPTRLYYHFNLLEKHGLIQVVATRVVSGIIEKHYQVTAYEFNVDRQLLAPTAQEGWQLVWSQTLDVLQRDIAHLAESGALQALIEAEAQGQAIPMRISKALMRLSPSRAQAFLERLKALIAEFEAPQAEPGEGVAPYAFFVAFYPAPSLPAEEEVAPPDDAPDASAAPPPQPDSA